MARIRGSARRYAAAAFELARDTDSFDSWASALERAADLLQIPEAARALTSPAVPEEQRLRTLRTLLPDLPSRLQVFLEILVRRERLELVPEILADFQRRVDDYRGVTTVEVTTAIPLDPQTEQVLATRLGAYTGRQVRLETRVDPEIIGGVVARIGDELLDDSVRGRLDRLRRRLVGGVESGR